MYVVCGLVCYPFLPFLKRSDNALRACVRVQVYMSAYVACFVFKCEVVCVCNKCVCVCLRMRASESARLSDHVCCICACLLPFSALSETQ